MNIGLLNVHSNFSLLRGVSRIPKLVKAAKKNNIGALALTDSNNMYGAIRFYKACKGSNIKPILGVNLFFLNRANDGSFTKIIILAKNNNGYTNLCRLLTKANFNIHNDRGIANVGLDTLKKINKDLILILPTFNSPISELVTAGLKSEAQSLTRALKEIFGENLYFGKWVDENLTESKLTLMQTIMDENNIKTIPLPTIYYIHEEDKLTKEILFKIQHSNLSDKEDENLDVYMGMLSKAELEKRHSKEQLNNLDRLIGTIDIELELEDWIFPQPKLMTGFTAEEQFKKNIEDGLKFRGLKNTGEVKKRIEYEFSIIKEKGFIDYFLIVISIIEEAQKRDIFTTTRGSVGGSFISYLTGITTIDPIEYQIPFERFLNPQRPSAPDVDIDVEDEKRDELIQAIIEKYDTKNVAQIGTFGRMMARMSVRDTARALGYSYSEGDRIAKLIPLGKQGMPMYIDKALDIEKGLGSLYRENDDVKKIVDLAKKIELNPRHVSTHAAGIVISPKPLADYVPLELNTRDNNKVVTQYDLNDIESIGLLKFDILGLTNLTILSETKKLIKRIHGIDINLDTLPLNDKKALRLISDGFTSGLFQLGGEGMTRVAKKLKPENIHDISALISLFRPGPAQNIDKYIKRKNKREATSFFHPKMERHLDKSYGILVYQEDLLNTAIELADYDWGEVDVFRKAVGKKIPELMKKQEKIFKERAMKHSGVSKPKADRIWDLFEPFKGYGFNKAHGLAYAKVSYQTAYLKAHYTTEFMTTCLSSESANQDTLKKYVSEARQLGINLLTLDINKSQKKFWIEGNNLERNIRFGFDSIKGLSSKVLGAIIKVRREKEFTGMTDFVERVSGEVTIDRRSLVALIKVGCFDQFENRNTLLKNIDAILVASKEMSNVETNTSTLFDVKLVRPQIELKEFGESDEMERLTWEKEFLGLYVSGHPLRLKNHTAHPDAIDIDKIRDLEDSSPILVVGFLDSIRSIRTSSGKRVLILTIEDKNGDSIKATCFEDTIEEYEEYIVKDTIVKLAGVVKIDDFNNEKRVMVYKFMDI